MRDIVLFFCKVFKAKGKLANHIPSVAIPELGQGVERATTLEEIVDICGGVGGVVGLGDCEGLVAGHLLAPFQ